MDDRQLAFNFKPHWDKFRKQLLTGKQEKDYVRLCFGKKT